MISSGGLTDRLDRLGKAGLVHRPAGDGDGRSLPVELTDEGRRRTEAAFRADMLVEADLLRGLSDHECKTLANLLRKLSLTMGRTRQSEA
jgi:DNA-binding MarR family transcriptional regulator